MAATPPGADISYLHAPRLALWAGCEFYDLEMSMKLLHKHNNICGVLCHFLSQYKNKVRFGSIIKLTYSKEGDKNSYLSSFCLWIVCTDVVDRCPTQTIARPRSPVDTARHTASPGSVLVDHRTGRTLVPDLEYKRYDVHECFSDYLIKLFLHEERCHNFMRKLQNGFK